MYRLLNKRMLIFVNKIQRNNGTVKYCLGKILKIVLYHFIQFPKITVKKKNIILFLTNIINQRIVFSAVVYFTCYYYLTSCLFLPRMLLQTKISTQTRISKCRPNRVFHKLTLSDWSANKKLLRTHCKLLVPTFARTSIY